MAGPWFCIWLESRGRRDDDPLARRLDLLIARWSLVAFFLGAGLGMALLGVSWLMGRADYFAAVRMVPTDRLVYTLCELVFYYFCMVAYCRLAGRRIGSPSPRHPWTSQLLAIAAASNLMYHFPALFTMLTVLSHRPEWWHQTLDRSLYHELLTDPEVVSRVAHVWLAAIATVAVVVMLLATSVPQDQRPRGTRLAASAAFGAFVASVLQIPVGLWLASALPESHDVPLWQADGYALALLAVAVGLTLLLCRQIAEVAFAGGDHAEARRAIVTLAVIVLLMCGAEQRLADLPVDAAARRTVSTGPEPSPQISRR